MAGPADERDELTPAQQVLGAALVLNEAVYELMSYAQTPNVLAKLLASHAADTELEAPFSEVFDKIAEGVCNLFHAAGRPDELERFAEAAARWVRGGD